MTAKTAPRAPRSNIAAGCCCLNIDIRLQVSAAQTLQQLLANLRHHLQTHEIVQHISKPIYVVALFLLSRSVQQHRAAFAAAFKPLMQRKMQTATATSQKSLEMDFVGSRTSC